MNENCLKIMETLDNHELTEKEIISRLKINKKSIHKDLAILLGRNIIEVAGNMIDPQTNRRVAVYKNRS